MSITVSLEGKSALVTGGGTNIGLGIARRLAEAGAAVTLMGRRVNILNDAAATLRTDLPEADIRIAAGDVTVQEDLAAAVSIASVSGPLDVVIANAGGSPQWSSLADSSRAMWLDALDLNLVGVAMTMAAAVPVMASGDSSVVCISSQSALRPAQMNPMYSASKAAVDALVRSAAVELAPRGIRVNGIRPGLVLPAGSARAEHEPFTTLVSRTLVGRHGLPSEIGDAALFLSCSMSSFVTGQVLNVCGGLTVSDADDLSAVAAWRRGGTEF